MRILNVFVLLIILSCNLNAAEMRVWKNNSGKSIEAEYLNFDEENEIVHIRLKNGKENKVKLSIFSEEDLEWVRSGGKDATDDPFGDSAAISEPLRIIVSISDIGFCKYRIEKASKPFDDGFHGEPYSVDFLPKTKAWKAEDGRIKMTYDFSDPDSLQNIANQGGRNNVAINKQKGALSMTAIDNKKQIGIINFIRRPIFPSTIALELSDYADTNLILVFGINGGLNFEHQFEENKLVLAIKKTGEPKKTLYESEAYPLEAELDCGLMFPLEKGEKLDKPVFFNIRQLTPQKTVSIKKITFIGRMSPLPGIGLEEKESQFFLKQVTRDHGICEDVGLKPGDKLISVDGKELKSLKEAWDAMLNLELGKKTIIVVERDGKRLNFEIK